MFQGEYLLKIVERPALWMGQPVVLQWCAQGGRCCAWHRVVVHSKAGVEVTFWFHSVPSPASKAGNWLAPFARHKSSINEQEPGTAHAFYVSFVNLTTSREL